MNRRVTDLIRPVVKSDWLIDMISLAVILFVFYTLWLGSYPLFTPDEGRYSEVAREMVATGDYITPRVNGVAFLDKPVLYYWLQAAAIKAFGVKEWALRLFPALLGILGCLVTYLCGRCLFNRRTALISSLILATTPLYFGSAHYADLNLEVAVFISCTLLFFITAVQREGYSRTGFLFAAYIFAALAFLTKGLIGIAFPGMIAGAWIVILWRWDLLKKIRIMTGLSVIIIITLPWYILVQQANPEFLHFFFVTQQVTRFLSAYEFNNKTPFWFYFPVVLAGAFPWTIFLIQALSKTIVTVWQDRRKHQTELFLLLWLTSIFLFFSIPQSKTIGYILPILPALALLVGNYLSCYFEQAKQKSIYFGIANFVVISTLLAVFLLLVLPHLKLVHLTPDFMPYLTAIAMVFIISAITSLCFIKKATLLPLFATCVACSTLFLLILTLGATYLNQDSAKPLAAHLKTIIQPQDEIVNYLRFYQDVPLYLEKQVTIVADWRSPNIVHNDNWLRELWFGMAFQKTDDWLINEKTFWQRFESDKRLFVFTSVNYLNKFKSRKKSYFQIGQYNNIILLSNQPTLAGT
jgi:4-amino-4-deoxy-L-arabinose transferase-like glycosyltransferase